MKSFAIYKFKQLFQPSCQPWSALPSVKTTLWPKKSSHRQFCAVWRGETCKIQQSAIEQNTKQVSVFLLCLHSLLTSAHSLTIWHQQASGAASKALAGIGGENSAQENLAHLAGSQPRNIWSKIHSSELTADNWAVFICWEKGGLDYAEFLEYQNNFHQKQMLDCECFPRALDVPHPHTCPVFITRLLHCSEHLFTLKTDAAGERRYLPVHVYVCFSALYLCACPVTLTKHQNLPPKNNNRLCFRSTQTGGNMSNTCCIL